MRLAEGAKIVNFALADSAEEKEDGPAEEENGESAGSSGSYGGEYEAAVTDGGDGFVTEMDLGRETEEEEGIDAAEAEEIPDGHEEE